MVLQYPQLLNQKGGQQAGAQEAVCLRVKFEFNHT